jgi:cytochrome d ubiquinol oxidase subunit II
MSLTPSAAFLLLVFVLFLYAMAAAIDFGSGAVWLWAELRGRADVAALAMRYASPVWEVVNVFFILFAVGMVGFFPGALPAVGTAMLVPGALGLGAIAVRSLAFVLRGASPPWAPRLFPWLVGVSGLAAPLPFVTLFALLEGVGVRPGPGGVAVNLAALFLDPLTLLFMLAAVAAEIGMGALFLAFYARPAREPWAFDTLTRAAPPALAVMALALLAALIPLHALSPHAGSGVWFLFALAAGAEAAAVSLARWRQPGPGLLAALAGGLMGLMAMAWAQLPWLVRGRLTLAAAFTNPAMAGALTAVLGIGMVIVVPSAVYLSLLVLADARRAARAAPGDRAA